MTAQQLASQRAAGWVDTPRAGQAASARPRSITPKGAHTRTPMLSASASAGGAREWHNPHNQPRRTASPAASQAARHPSQVRPATASRGPARVRSPAVGGAASGPPYSSAAAAFGPPSSFSSTVSSSVAMHSRTPRGAGGASSSQLLASSYGSVGGTSPRALTDLEAFVGEVMGVRMRSMADLKTRLEDLSRLHQREEAALHEQMRGLLAQSEAARHAQEMSEGHFEALLEKERRDRERVVGMMRAFKSEGARVIEELRTSLAEAQRGWHEETGRSAKLAAQLRMLQQSGGNHRSQSPSQHGHQHDHHHHRGQPAQEDQIAVLRSLLEEEDAIIVELQQRNKVLEGRAVAAGAERDRLRALITANDGAAAEIDAEYNALLSQLKKDRGHATAGAAVTDATAEAEAEALHTKVVLLNRFAAAVVNKLKSEQRQRLFTEEQAAKVVEALEARIRRMEDAATAATADNRAAATATAAAAADNRAATVEHTQAPAAALPPPAGAFPTSPATSAAPAGVVGGGRSVSACTVDMDRDVSVAGGAAAAEHYHTTMTSSSSPPPSTSGCNSGNSGGVLWRQQETPEDRTRRLRQVAASAHRAVGSTPTTATTSAEAEATAMTPATPRRTGGLATHYDDGAATDTRENGAGSRDSRYGRGHEGGAEKDDDDDLWGPEASHPGRNGSTPNYGSGVGSSAQVSGGRDSSLERQLAAVTADFQASLAAWTTTTAAGGGGGRSHNHPHPISKSGSGADRAASRSEEGYDDAGGAGDEHSSAARPSVPRLSFSPNEPANGRGNGGMSNEDTIDADDDTAFFPA